MDSQWSTAYKDILTAASRKAALKGQPSGFLASKMNGKQLDALMALTYEYAADKDIYFAWSGGINQGEPHYYRVQTGSFLIELDDTQDHANHIHSVWRDLNGDFGAD